MKPTDRSGRLRVGVCAFMGMDVHDGGYVRVIGLTRDLPEFNNDVVFFSPLLPEALHGRVHHTGLFPKRMLAVPYCAYPRLLSLMTLMPADRRTAFIINEQSPSILHAHSHDTAYCLLKLKRRLSAPIVFESHGLMHLQKADLQTAFSDLRISLMLRAERYLFQQSDAILLRDAKERDYVVEYFAVDPSRIYLVPDGVDDDFLGEPVPDATRRALRERLNVDGRRIILFAGFFKEVSGVLDLVRAFKLLSSRYDDLLLILVGDGPLMPKVKALIREEQVANVCLPGFVPRDELPCYQQIADVLVVPENRDIFNQFAPPIKFFECLASGRPTIVTNLKCHADIVRGGVHAMLVEPDDPQDMARGILRMLNAPNARAIGSRARHLMVSKYSWRSVTEQLASVYAEIVSRAQFDKRHVT